MSRRDVIRRIVARDTQNLELTEEAVQQDDAELHESACRLFGTWDTALEYAGVNMRRVAGKRDADRETLLQAIRRLCGEAGILEETYIRRRRQSLYKAALKHFPTWDDALRAAGIQPENIHRPPGPASRPSSRRSTS